MGAKPKARTIQIRRQLELGAGPNQERTRPVGFHQAEFGADEPQAGDLALIVAQDGDGRQPGTTNRGAFLAGILILWRPHGMSPSSRR